MANVALITGGSRGIGLGIARALAAEGWHLAINGVREESQLTQVLDDLRCTGVEVLYTRADVSDLSSHRRMLDAVLSRFGHLHALVNNAGIAPTVRADLLEMDEGSYDRVMNVNLRGTLFLTKVIANYFVDRKRQDPAFDAKIVNISSISATVVSVNRGEYCISKAGLSMVTQLYAARLGEFGIPVYEVRPGVTRSDMTSVVEDKYSKLIAEGLCVQKRWGEPEDNGKAVAALLRGDFPYSTGQVIMVDGGLTIARL